MEESLAVTITEPLTNGRFWLQAVGTNYAILFVSLDKLVIHFWKSGT